jgi:hypothetical protein
MFIFFMFSQNGILTSFLAFVSAMGLTIIVKSGMRRANQYLVQIPLAYNQATLLYTILVHLTYLPQCNYSVLRAVK